MTLLETIAECEAELASLAVLLGVKAASVEAADKYGDPEDYPEPLKSFLNRACEVAEEFIDRLGLDD